MDRFVETAAGGLVGDTPMAIVDWRAAVDALDAGRLPCSAGEGRVLRIAASIAAGIPVALDEALSGLDEHNLGLVADAVLRAGGRRGGLARSVVDRPFGGDRR